MLHSFNPINDLNSNSNSNSNSTSNIEEEKVEEDEDEEEIPSISLDENGFPLFQEDANENENENANENKNGEGSFAAEFYESGSDWSSLLLKNNNNDSKKIMKQSNLFQMWGIKPPLHKNQTTPFVGVSSNTSSSVSKPPTAPLKPTLELELRPSTKRKFMNVPQGKPRPCPFYKKIPGTPFTVDAFKYGAIEGCSAYFLSHFHADHYGGLSKAWSHGPIYCTSITARLVKMCLYVNPLYICPLELDIEHEIDGVKVTLLEANHCPGAALIHFILPNGQRILHTGDFRACKSMQNYPLLVNKKVNVLYLDTTYCNAKYRFPLKEEVTSFVVKTTKACLKKQPKTLIVVGAYSIGKESVYIAISEAIKVKIYANASRRRILQSFNWPQLSKNLCSNGKDTPLHVLPISSLRHETLKNYLKTYQNQFNAVLAFRPTGWTFSESVGNQLDRIKPNSKENIQIYGVPYSEHSSFTELEIFVQFLRPNKIIPTVNISNAANREKQQSYFRQWLNG